MVKPYNRDKQEQQSKSCLKYERSKLLLFCMYYALTNTKAHNSFKTLYYLCNEEKLVLLTVTTDIFTSLDLLRHRDLKCLDISGLDNHITIRDVLMN